MKVITPANVPAPKYAEGDHKLDARPAFEPSDEKGSALHSEESQREAMQRVYDRVWNQMIPERRKHDPRLREIEDAYEGVVMAANTNKESKVFPLVFMLVDAKMGAVMAHRPKAVFEVDLERKKIPLIEKAYEHYTSDAEDGVIIEAVDHIWEWYAQLYGWSIKRVWHEVDTEIRYDPKPQKDEKGNYIYGEDGFVLMEYHRCIHRKTRLKQKVYDWDKVAVDPLCKFLYEADDIVFIEDIHFNEFEQQYRFNPTYENTEFVHAGAYHKQEDAQTMRGEDVSGNPATVFAGAQNLNKDMVRIEEYYCRSRCEYMVKANGIPILHIPNPTPLNWLPAADLHNRLRPKSFYSKGEGELAEPIIAIYQKMMNAKTRQVELAASPVVLTDTNSGLSPKAVKVYPGAHWKGMKGRAEVLDLGGNSGGEVSEYLLELRNLTKIVTGIDFERLIADPDPTAVQQAARDAASRLRPEKDITLNENIGHVRAMDITVQTIQRYMTIPILADLKDLSDEERKQLQPQDIIDDNTYYQYNKIRTPGVLYLETYDKSNEAFSLMPDKKKVGDGYLRLRPEFLQTKSRVKVRAVSDRSQTTNKQVKYEMASDLYNRAFSTPPKNQAEIEQAIASGSAPPSPIYFLNREEAIKMYVNAVGGDVDQLTAPEGEKKPGPNAEAIRELMAARKPLAPVPPPENVPSTQSAAPMGAPPSPLAPTPQTPRLPAVLAGAGRVA